MPQKLINCLIANSDALQTHILSTMLYQFDNYVVTSVQNGYQAYEILVQSKEKFLITNDKSDLFDIVILDLQMSGNIQMPPSEMPILDGFDTCKSINGFFNQDAHI